MDWIKVLDEKVYISEKIEIRDWIKVINEKEYDSKKIIKSDIVSVPVGAEKITVRIKRMNWVEAGKEVVFVKIAFSLDGINWAKDFLGFATRGGDFYTVENELAEYTTAIRLMPEPKNTNRKVRISLTIANDVSLTTFMEVGFE